MNDSIKSLFRNHIPSIVKNVEYIPFNASEIEYKDDYGEDFVNYYTEPIDIRKGHIDSFTALGEDPLIHSNTETLLPLQETYFNTESIPIDKKNDELISTFGSHQFKNEDIDVRNMQEFLNMLYKNGIYVRVTSGFRKDAITSNNAVSNHASGNAIDITPIDGETWEQLITKMKNSPEVREFMRKNKMRILDERSSETLAKTGGTGAHLHISYGKTEGKSSDEFFA